MGRPGLIDRLLGLARRQQTKGATLEEIFEESLFLSLSGNDVSPASSLRLSTVFGAVNMIAKDLAKLPIAVKRRRRDGALVEDAAHPAHRLLRRRPNPWQTAFHFKHFLAWQSQLYGNGYAVIRRTAGAPDALIPISATRVSLEVTNELAGEFRYTIDLENGRRISVRPEDVFHLRVMGDQFAGFAQFSLARDSIGLGLAAQEFSSRFFNNGVVTKMKLEHPGELTDKQLAHLRSSISKTHGGLQNMWKPLILEEGMKAEMLGQSNDDAQLTELRNGSVRDLANWWNIPPHKLGDTSRTSFNSLEQENQSYLDTALDGLLVAFEEEAELKLLTEAEQMREIRRVEFDREELQRANIRDRGEWLTKAVQAGILSRDEAREKIGENPMPDGEGAKFFMPTNLQIVGEEPEPAPVPAALDGAEEEDGEEGEDEGLEAPAEAASGRIRPLLRQIVSRETRRLFSQLQKQTPESVERWIGDELERKNRPGFEFRAAPALEAVRSRVDAGELADWYFSEVRGRLDAVLDWRESEFRRRLEAYCERAPGEWTEELTDGAETIVGAPGVPVST